MINIDKSGSNKEAIQVYNKRKFTRIKYRQCKYLNNIIEQDHRFIKRQCRHKQWFRKFSSAEKTISGFEAIHMIKKGQIKRIPKGDIVAQNNFIDKLFGIAA